MCSVGQSPSLSVKLCASSLWGCLLTAQTTHASCKTDEEIRDKRNSFRASQLWCVRSGRSYERGKAQPGWGGKTFVKRKRLASGGNCLPTRTVSLCGHRARGVRWGRSGISWDNSRKMTQRASGWPSRSLNSTRLSSTNRGGHSFRDWEFGKTTGLGQRNCRKMISSGNWLFTASCARVGRLKLFSKIIGRSKHEPNFSLQPYIGTIHFAILSVAKSKHIPNLLSKIRPDAPLADPK